MPYRIDTRRLTLFVPWPSDAERYCAFFVRNAAHREEFMGATQPHRYGIEAMRATLQRIPDDVLSGTHIPFAIALRNGAGGEIIGSINISDVKRGLVLQCYLGYELDEHVQGNGYMSEAVDAVCEFAFTTLKLHRVCVNYQPSNERSAAVARRCGFVVEGLAKDLLYINGTWRDHVLAARTSPYPIAPEGSDLPRV